MTKKEKVPYLLDDNPAVQAKHIVSYIIEQKGEVPDQTVKDFIYFYNQGLAGMGLTGLQVTGAFLKVAQDFLEQWASLPKEERNPDVLRSISTNPNDWLL